MFMNAKDAPFAVAMAVLLLGLVRALDEYPQPERAHRRAGRRRPRARLRLAHPGRHRRAGRARRAAVDRRRGKPRRRLRSGRAAASANSSGAAAGAGARLSDHGPALAVVDRCRRSIRCARRNISHFFEKPWRELYEGRLIAVPDMPASYLPHLFVLKLPEIMLALGLAGTVGALIVAARAQRAGQPPRRPAGRGARRRLADRGRHGDAAGDL